MKNEAGQAETNDLLRQLFPSPEDRAQRIEAWARDILQQHNLPDRAGYVLVERGTWRWMDPQSPSSNLEYVMRTNGRILWAPAYAQRDVDSLAWFAATALDLVVRYREAVAAGRMPLAIYIFGRLEATVERCKCKTIYEKLALDGRRMQEGRSKGAPHGALANRIAGGARYDALVVAANAAWVELPHLVGEYSRTARLLFNNWRRFSEDPQEVSLSVERMRKLLSHAHKRGDLGT